MDEIVLARQPIFNNQLQVQFYELLYRATHEHEEAEVEDGDMATTKVLMNLFAEIGYEKVTNNHLAFINLTENLILSDFAKSFPKDKVVLEILESIDITSELINKVRELTHDGYKIALDDFVYSDVWRPLLEVAHFVKLDVCALSEKELDENIKICRQYKCKILAEKIETHEMFEQCLAKGFDYFQGFFLCKPKIVKGETLAANKAVIIRILSELHKEDSETDVLSEMLSQDAVLSLKLLRMLNSAAYNLPRKIESIQEAVVMLGRNQIKKLANMILLTNVADKPNELMYIALARAKQAELIAEKLKLPNKDTFFTEGLLSMLDALMDQSLPVLLENIPLADDLKEALLERKGLLGEVLSNIENYERGAWDRIELQPNITEADYQVTYLEALQWAGETMGALGG